MNTRSLSFGADRLAVALPMLAAAGYPAFLLLAFKGGKLWAAGSPSLAVLSVAIGIVLAFAVPAWGFAMAFGLSASSSPNASRIRARSWAHLVFAAPPMFTLLGVLTYMFGVDKAEVTVWVVFWAALAAMLVFQRDGGPAARGAESPDWLRSSHGVVAAVVLLGFLAMHVANHLTGLISAETHLAVMDVLRRWYRHPVVEPVLVVLMAFMVLSGLWLLRGKLAQRADFFQTLHTATGVYLLFYIPGHMNSTFNFQRSFLAKDSDFWFAAGGPLGLLMSDPWNVRLIPHYVLGVWALITHAAGGLRIVLIAHGVRERMANRVTLVISLIGALAAIGAVLPLLRLHFGGS